MVVGFLTTLLRMAHNQSLIGKRGLLGRQNSGKATSRATIDFTGHIFGTRINNYLLYN